MSSEDKVRLKITGNIEGQAVEVFVYDSDLAEAIEVNDRGEEYSFLEDVGIAKFFVQQVVENQGIIPWPKRGGSSETSAANTSGEWRCPLHPNAKVFDREYGVKDGRKKCGYSEVFSGGDVPDWGKVAVAKKGDNQGKPVVYCQKVSG